MKLATQTKILRTRSANYSIFCNNRLFKSNPKSLFVKLKNKEYIQLNNSPSESNVQKYWGELFGEKAKHNAQAEQLINEKAEMEDKTKDIWEDIKPEIPTETTKKLANQKAPGPDRVHIFC